MVSDRIKAPFLSTAICAESVEHAISGIHTGLYEFYIVEPFKEIGIRIIGDLKKSLTSTGPGYLHNLLDDLPDCP